MTRPRALLALLVAWTPAVLADRATDKFLYELKQDGQKQGLKGTWTNLKGMNIYISLPQVRAPADGHPFVVVAHHAVGIYNDKFLREFCDNLASEGFACMLPDLFHRIWSEQIPHGHGIPTSEMKIMAQVKSQRDEELLADIQTTVDYAKLVSDARVFRVGVLGFCMGGRVAWLAGTAEALSEEVRGVVAYHGGNVFKALPEDAGTAPGENLEALHCPVLGHFAGEDQNPSPEDQDKLQIAGKALGKEMEFHSYAGVKHGFSCRDSSSYDVAAAKEAWPRTVAFLRKALASETAPGASGEL